MITLEDFQKYETLEQELKEFLIEKCIDLEKAAKGEDVETFFENDYDDFEKKGDFIKVWFRHFEANEIENYTIDLPLGIVFESDFKEILKKQFDEAKEFARRELEKIRLKEAESKKHFEIIRLKELMEKYPDVVDNK